MGTQDASRVKVPRRAIPSWRIVSSAVKAHNLSALAVGGFLGTCILLTFLLGTAGVLELGFIYTNWGTLWGPAWTSLVLTVTSFLLGLALATPLGVVRAYAPAIFRRTREEKKAGASRAGRRRAVGERSSRRARGTIRKALLAPAYGLATGYIEAIRGTPFYVQMWIVFYLISLIWPRLPNLFFIIGLVALTLSTVGYQAEVLRAGFQSVGQGQIDAAKAVGMRGRQIFAHVTLPQGLRLVVLPLTNEWIGLFKTTSILNFISVQELMFQAQELGGPQAHPIEAFLMVAVMYFAILMPLSRVVTYIERKKRIPGLGTPMDVTRAAARRRAGVTV